MNAADIQRADDQRTASEFVGNRLVIGMLLVLGGGGWAILDA